MEQFTKNVASKHSTPMIDKVNPDKFISGETVADEAYFNDGGSWTALAITDTFSEIGTTGVYEIDLTAAERNHDQIIIKMTSANSQDNAIKINAIPAPANMKEIEEDLLSGNNAILRLRQFNILGQGSEAAISAEGGPSGRGMHIRGGSNSGEAAFFQVQGGNGDAIIATAFGDGNGFKAVGGVTGKGIDAFEIDLLNYPDGFIYMLTTASNTNTVLGTDGTSTVPVSTLAAAKTLAEALGTKKIKVLGAGALTLPAGSWNNFELVAQSNFFNLGLTLTGSTPLNTTFRNFTINGTHNTSNRNRFISCLINSVNMFGDCIECAFNVGPITVDDCRLIDCYPQNLVTTTIAVNGSSDVNIVRWGGNLKIGAVSAGGALDINLQGGELELTSAFNGGTMRATGYGKFTDNSTSGIRDVDNFLEITDVGDLSSILGTNLTETTAGNLANNLSTFYDNADSLTSKLVDNVGGSGASASEVADAVWDELRAGHVDAGSFGENVNSNLVKIGGSPSVDGLAIVTMFENLIARAQGDVVRTGNSYAYKKQNGTTTAFTYTVSSGGRV